MASLAQINIKFAADLKQFSTKMQNAQRSITKMGRKLQRVGKGLSIGVTAPIVALGTASVIAFDKQAKAIAQVEAGLKSTGNAANKTSEQLQAMASQLQNTSLFGDEEILKDVTAQLLTFTNIAGTQFDRTQQAALDLATRLDGDLKSASIQLGKALNDPVANLSALSRSGIQFSNEQKALIKSLVETNRLADAQTIILDELDKQYGGAAQAAARAGTGPLKQLQNTLGDLSEQFGEIISEAILPLVEYVKDLATRFSNLDKSTKKIIVVVAALLAALGPVLLALGSLATMLPAIGAALAALTGPVGLVIAALAGIGVVIYKYWEPIKETLVDIANYFIDLYNESMVFRAGVEAAALVFKQLWQGAVFAFDVISSGLGTMWDQFKNVFKNIGDLIKAVLTGNFEELPNILKTNLSQSVEEFQKFKGKITGDWEKFTKGLKDNADTALNNVFRGKIEFIKDDVDTDALEKEIEETVARATNNGFNKSAGSGGSIKLPPIQAPEIIIPEIQRPNADAPLEIVTQNDVDVFDERLAQMQANAAQFAEELAPIMETAAEGFAVGFGQLLGQAAQGGNFLQGFFTLFVDTLATVAIQVGKTAIGIGLAVDGIKAALKSLSGPVAIAAGVALVALGTLAKSALSSIADGGPTPFANGGIVSGPVNALVGEYAGARNNPEVIAPLDKLQRLLGPMGGGTTVIEGEFVLRGNDLVRVIKRQENRDSRTR